MALQALHPAQPSALVLYCSDFKLTLIHTGRSLDHRNQTGAKRATSAKSGFLIVCCNDCTPASFPYASASFTHSHTLSLDSYCRPPVSSSSPTTSVELGLRVGLGLGLDSLAPFSSHALPFFSPPSFHTLFLFPGFTSVWWSD